MKRRTNPVSKPTLPSTRNLEQIIEERTQAAVVRALSEGGVVQQYVRQTIVQSYSGPLPTAEETAKYESILPGFTHRFVTMAETAQKADLETIARRDHGVLRYKMAALACSVSLGGILLIGGIWLIAIDKTLEGFGAIGTAAAAVILAVLRKQKEPDRN